jgi:hypothetical protein
MDLDVHCLIGRVGGRVNSLTYKTLGAGFQRNLDLVDGTLIWIKPYYSKRREFAHARRLRAYIIAALFVVIAAELIPVWLVVHESQM